LNPDHFLCLACFLLNNIKIKVEIIKRIKKRHKKRGGRIYKVLGKNISEIMDKKGAQQLE